MARSARCHNEHDDKPLKTGPPLNERLRDETGEERHAVTLYTLSLMKTGFRKKRQHQNLSPSAPLHPSSKVTLSWSGFPT
jgi:hypothetical protein